MTVASVTATEMLNSNAEKYSSLKTALAYQHRLYLSMPVHFEYWHRKWYTKCSKCSAEDMVLKPDQNAMCPEDAPKPPYS
jgi:hypothetical protein